MTIRLGDWAYDWRRADTMQPKGLMFAETATRNVSVERDQFSVGSGVIPSAMALGGRAAAVRPEVRPRSIQCEELRKVSGKRRFGTSTRWASRAFGRGTLAGLGLAALVLAVGPGTLAVREAPANPIPNECRNPDLSAAEQARCDFIARTPDLCLRGGLSEETQRFCDELDEPAACAWPFELAAEGLGNILFPDNNARYPIMLFDDEWREMTITGSYPEARFMSYTIYFWTNFETDEVGDHLYDAQIVPDPGSINPFVSPGGEDGTYTLTVTRDETAEGANVLRVAAEPPWLVYRLYLPDMGENSLGGPLPTVTVTDWEGESYQLEPCPSVNDFYEVIPLLPEFFPPGFELPEIPDPSTDRLWLYPISPLPDWIGPNPDSKYVGAFGVDLQPGRVLVIRGRAPGFPDTYFGSPIWEPAPGFDDVQLRYWSLCNNDLVLPLPVVECVADLRTRLDEDGFYTYVISNDLFAPEWVPSDATWVPWGSERMPKLINFRNTLPAADFNHAAQAAIDEGCALPPPFGSAEDVPTEEEVEQAGRCSQEVMEEYYPVAAWCDEDLFIDLGWQACFAAAGIP